MEQVVGTLVTMGGCAGSVHKICPSFKKGEKMEACALTFQPSKYAMLLMPSRLEGGSRWDVHSANSIH